MTSSIESLFIQGCCADCVHGALHRELSSKLQIAKRSVASERRDLPPRKIMGYESEINAIDNAGLAIAVGDCLRRNGVDFDMRLRDALSLLQTLGIANDDGAALFIHFGV